MRITFTNRAERAPQGRTRRRVFEADRTYDLPEAEALYWIGRSAAVKAEDGAEAEEQEGDDGAG